MPDSPNNLFQFWQELKRRRVIHVIVVYATASFVILELVNNVFEPLRLPEWTPTLVIIILLVGFPLAIIFSWIFDVTPEGIEKTEPAHKLKEVDKPVTSSSWKIASYISFVVIVALIIFHITSRSNRSEELSILAKSIAVLPFRNDSPEKKDDHVINGTMESILNNLCKINDLKVISRSSIEQYRDTAVSIPDVAEKLEVSYVLEGSMQKYGNQIRLTLQMIDRNDKHIWAEQYDREIREAEEFFDMYSEIALLVAAEIEAIITLDEKQRIEKIPTTNMEAYDSYVKGRYYWNKRTENDLLESQKYFDKAIELDPKFAQAWTGLADSYAMLSIYTYMPANEGFSKAKAAANEAIKLNSTLGEAHATLGLIHAFYDHDWEKSQAAFKLALKYEPSYATAHLWYANMLLAKGEFDAAEQHIQLARNLDPLSNIIQALVGRISSLSGSFERAEDLFTSAIELNPNFPRFHLFIANNYIMEGNYDSALVNMEIAVFLSQRHPQYLSNLAYCYGITNQVDKANMIYQEILEKSDVRFVSNYDIALTLLGMQEEALAMEYLKKAYETKDYWVTFLAVDQRFNHLRSNPDFISIIKKIGINLN